METDDRRFAMIHIYGFLDDDFVDEAVAGSDKEIIVLCQCGASLLQLIMDKTADAKYAIGLTSHEHHDLYHAHCAKQHQGEAFSVEWVDDPSKLPKFRQPGVEVVEWSQDDLDTLTDQFRASLPIDQEHKPIDKNR
jgi:hypothetical protein